MAASGPSRLTSTSSRLKCPTWCKFRPDLSLRGLWVEPGRAEVLLPIGGRDRAERQAGKGRGPRHEDKPDRSCWRVRGTYAASRSSHHYRIPGRLSEGCWLLAGVGY